jgi:hypothetical protein
MQAFASGEINWLLVLLVVRLADVADEGMGMSRAVVAYPPGSGAPFPRQSGRSLNP